MFTKFQKISLFVRLGLLLVTLSGLMFTQTASAQDDEKKSPPTSQERKDDAEARKRESEARDVEVATLTNEIALLKGETTATGEMIETKLSAYKAVACSANVINKNLIRFQSSIDSLLIYDEEFVGTLAEFSVLMYQFNLLEDKYSQAYTTATAKIAKSGGTNTKRGGFNFGLDPVQSVRDLTIDTLALFKTDTVLTGTDVDIGKEEFIAKAVNNLNNVDVYYPNKAIPGLTEVSPFLIKMNTLAQYRLKADDVLENSAIGDDLTREIRVLNDQYDRTLTQFGIFAVSELLGIKNRITEEEYGNLAEGLQKHYTEDGDSYIFNRESWEREEGRPLKRNIIDYLRAEMVHKMLTAKNGKQTYWLDVSVAAAGSNMRNKTSPVIDIFTGGNRMSFSGGAVVSYRIFNSQGRVLVTDTVMTYMPFKNSDSITGFKCRPTRIEYTP